jgi:hypothetical protein
LWIKIHLKKRSLLPYQTANLLSEFSLGCGRQNMPWGRGSFMFKRNWSKDFSEEKRNRH